MPRLPFDVKEIHTGILRPGQRAWRKAISISVP